MNGCIYGIYLISIYNSIFIVQQSKFNIKSGNFLLYFLKKRVYSRCTDFQSVNEQVVLVFSKLSLPRWRLQKEIICRIICNWNLKEYKGYWQWRLLQNDTKYWSLESCRPPVTPWRPYSTVLGKATGNVKSCLARPYE